MRSQPVLSTKEVLLFSSFILYRLPPKIKLKREKEVYVLNENAVYSSFLQAPICFLFLEEAMLKKNLHKTQTSWFVLLPRSVPVVCVCAHCLDSVTDMWALWFNPIY